MCGPSGAAWGQLGGNLVAGGRLGRMVRVDGFENWGVLGFGAAGRFEGWGAGHTRKHKKCLKHALRLMILNFLSQEFSLEPH